MRRTGTGEVAFAVLNISVHVAPTLAMCRRKCSKSLCSQVNNRQIKSSQDHRFRSSLSEGVRMEGKTQSVKQHLKKPVVCMCASARICVHVSFPPSFPLSLSQASRPLYEHPPNCVTHKCNPLHICNKDIGSFRPNPSLTH